MLSIETKRTPRNNTVEADWQHQVTWYS